MVIEKFHICLNHVRLHGYHGVADQEQRVGADYELNLDLTMPATHGCDTDNVDDTVNYADIFEAVKDEFKTSSNLIENLATRIGQRLFRDFRIIQTIDIEIIKLAPPIAGFEGNAAVRFFLRK